MPDLPRPPFDPELADVLEFLPIAQGTLRPEDIAAARAPGVIPLPESWTEGRPVTIEDRTVPGYDGGEITVSVLRRTDPVFDQVAADELIQWLLSDDIDAEIDSAGRALISASHNTVEYLWTTNPSGLRRGWAEVTTWMCSQGFEFSFCDTLANSTSMIVAVTGDTDVLREGVGALARLGEAHNRWHVRDVLTALLQSIRAPERALAALEGLQDVPPTAVDWSITDFAARTMHPVLRNGIREIRKPAQAS